MINRYSDSYSVADDSHVMSCLRSAAPHVVCYAARRHVCKQDTLHGGLLR